MKVAEGNMRSGLTWPIPSTGGDPAYSSYNLIYVGEQGYGARYEKPAH